ncbi:TetR/AcrR family transcriptional regulator [Arenicella xantha]|uniref:TetR family transcriptional regulator n=1 Tax=Arenicella xantha TaxID=644221 RepID=A0A395JI73_9GAMM|nr:TetR/AcrR family transcriptional regulator [Arenicella xantha]RBP49725.1 TetR family transcriptional regulator [Arenicella xantha]
MAKMRTRDLILDVALVLLNERGESIVTSVDLAHEMNISPGNLYYHFKGKEQVVEELYAQFHARVLVALQQVTSQARGNPKDTIAGLTVVSDILLQFQFISQDIRGIHERYASLRASISKLFSLLFQTLTGLVKLVLDKAAVPDASNVAKMMAGNLLYTLVNFGGYDDLLYADSSPPSIEEHLYLHFLPFLED